MNGYEICSEVYGLSGFGIPSAFFNSGDPDDRLIFFLLRRITRDIGKYRWQGLVRTGRITISPDQPEYNMPIDFREMIPNSIKTVGDLRPIDFPASFDTWSQIDAQIGITGTRHRLRFQADKLQTLPSDSEGYTIRFEYISNHLVQDSENEDLRYETFQDDANIWLLDDDMIIKGLKAKWSLEKGLDTLTADISDYNSYMLSLQGTDSSSQRIRIGGGTPYFPRSPYTNLWK